MIGEKCQELEVDRFTEDFQRLMMYVTIIERLLLSKKLIMSIFEC